MKKITFMATLLVAFTMNAQIFADDFEAETDGATTFVNWTALDLDGDGEFFAAVDIFGDEVEASPLNGLIVDSDSWDGAPLMPDNFLITTEPIDLTGISDATLAFTMGTYQIEGTFIEDRLQVYVSTSNDPPEVISTETPLLDTTVGDQTPADNGGANSAIDIVPLDLSSFAGQEVYIIFRHFDSTDNNSVLIDNIVVDSALSIEEIQSTNFTHFFNQSTGDLRVNATSTLDNIEVFSVTGQNVANRALNSNEGVISLNDLSNGVYIVRVTLGNATETFKVAK